MAVEFTPSKTLRKNAFDAAWESLKAPCAQPLRQKFSFDTMREFLRVLVPAVVGTVADELRERGQRESDLLYAETDDIGRLQHSNRALALHEAELAVRDAFKGAKDN